jgi:peptidoglycan/xylan/chitin deacetylase (PgdA/CDA1 family)
VRKASGVTAIILCYHKVGPAASEGTWLNVEPERLRSHVRFFSRRGYTFLRAWDLVGEWRRRSVVFSFDDSYVSTLENAPPILEEVGARGSFYAVPSKVGGASDWDGDRRRPLANWDTLRHAERQGHEIGNHTHSHVHLAELPFEEQREEVRKADMRLKEEGLSPKTFCYPYGSLADREAIEGYRIGLSLEKRIATPADDPLRLPRIIPSYSDSLPLLLYKIFVRPKLP